MIRHRTQNYGNHKHWVPLYHYGTLTAMGIAIIMSVILLVADTTSLMNWLFLLNSLIVVSVSFHCRSFALKAQDRAVRAEENFRYFILTGKRMDQSIAMEQIFALRFACDEEFPALAERAIHEQLSNDEIKRSIKNWRPDYYRA